MSPAMAKFLIVPVLDLKGGEVVHARAGERERYLPIRSRLAAGSAPAAVVDGLLSVAPFRRIYVADLDAIERRGDHRPVIADLARRHPGIEFWLDCGIATAAQAIAVADDGLTPVMGSESLADVETLAAAVARLDREGCVLSLDYRGERFLGPAELETQPGLWPSRLILMTLSRVGGSAGPDFARLAATKERLSHHALFAAGGVRDRADLDSLATLGVAGVLVASALHDGRLTPAALAGFAEGR
jgi:phosphoribosylformimino-5-aminoimidazole carboxamide ribotide isomerase